MTFKSIYIGKTVLNHLKTNTLIVHSIFNKGFNIINERDELIFIGTSENGLFPFGINIDADTKSLLLANIRIGDKVYFDGNYLNFKNNSLELNGKIIDFKKRMGKKLTAIDEIQQIDFNNYKTTDFKEDYIKKLLKDLESNEDYGMLRYFIGRGNGLTPSGDDILIGMLFIHAIHPFISPSKIRLLKKILKEESTTVVSKQFLKLAIDGIFSSRMTDLFNHDEIPENIERLLKVGSSSGKDTMYGIFSAIMRRNIMGKKVVLALGGNAILRPKQEPTYENQYKNVKEATDRMIEIKKAGHNIVVTHGNGPQVGNIIAQNEAAKDIIEPLPIFISSAESQGFIGFMIESALKNKLHEEHIDINVITIMTMVEVDREDQAFNHPTKPIGIFFSEEEAKKLEETKGFKMVEDAGRGYRRVVPSPEPKIIHGVDAINQLVDNTIIISSGGGGIPIYKDSNGKIHGVDAVIDKDRSGLKLAEQTHADVFMMLTDVSNVYINWGKENQEKLTHMTVDQAEQYIQENQFPAGSMLPKVEAAIEFAKTGKESIICSLEDAVDALAGKAGTRITL